LPLPPADVLGGADDRRQGLDQFRPPLVIAFTEQLDQLLCDDQIASGDLTDQRSQISVHCLVLLRDTECSDILVPHSPSLSHHHASAAAIARDLSPSKPGEPGEPGEPRRFPAEIPRFIPPICRGPAPIRGTDSGDFPWVSVLCPPIPPIPPIRRR